MIIVKAKRGNPAIIENCYLPLVTFLVFLIWLLENIMNPCLTCAQRQN